MTAARRRSIPDRVISARRSLGHALTGRGRLAAARRRRRDPKGRSIPGRVSFPIATYDRIDILLDRTIPSLLAQSHTDVEVIVVGDGTPPEDFARLEAIDDPRVRLHRLERRTRYPASALERWMVAGWRPRNVGASLATGEWLVWISDDDEVVPDGVERLIAAVAASPHAEVVTGAYQSGTREPRVFRPSDGVADVGFPFGGTGWMMHASLRGFKWNGESWRKSWNRPSDYDLVVRLRSAGARFFSTDDVIVIQHEVEGTGLVGRLGALAAASGGDEGSDGPTSPPVGASEGRARSDRELRWCSNCVAMSTRPRISFDERGWCNACRWAEQKARIDWAERRRALESLLERQRAAGRAFDCVVGVSGGKDGSFVSHSLKHRFGVRPLAVSVQPPLPLALGQRNLQAFADSGYDLIVVNVPPDPMRRLNRAGLIEWGFPYFGWLVAIHTALVRVAVNFGVDLIFYGEAGEIEYGGSEESADEAVYGIDYIKRIYLEDGFEAVLAAAGLSKDEQYWFTFPDGSEAVSRRIGFTEWSRFENWDPYRNYLVAKEHCGLAENGASNAGTFTNFAQNDQALYALHTYIMYLKFGFGRANQDAAIEIRRGAMDRAQAVNLVNLYDGHYPEEFIDQYLDYYRMSAAEFDAVLDKWANRDLFDKVDGRWRPRFRVV